MTLRAPSFPAARTTPVPKLEEAKVLHIEIQGHTYKTPLFIIPPNLSDKNLSAEAGKATYQQCK